MKNHSKKRIISIINIIKQELSITLNNVDEEINNNRDKIKTLTENNDALSLRVASLEKKKAAALTMSVSGTTSRILRTFSAKTQTRRNPSSPASRQPLRQMTGPRLPFTSLR